MSESAPPQRSSRPQSPSASAGRGVALVAIATLIGIFLLWKGPGSDNVRLQTESGDTTQTGNQPSKSTVATTTTAAAPATSVPPAQLTLVVANGSGKSGVAGALSDTLKAAGYAQVKATNTTGQIPNTVVYFDAGFEADARDVAEKAGIASTVVQARPAEVPLSAQDQTAHVLVLQGQDYTPNAAATTGAGGATTTAAGATGTTAG